MDLVEFAGVVREVRVHLARGTVSSSRALQQTIQLPQLNRTSVEFDILKSLNITVVAKMEVRSNILPRENRKFVSKTAESDSEDT